MKKLLVLAFIFCLAGNLAFGQSKPDAQPKMNHYMVIVSHTPDQCATAMNEFKDKSSLLSKIAWGCMSGDHTAYAFLDGKDEAAVRAMLPGTNQKTAKVIKVDKLNAQQIEAMHKPMK